MFSHVSVILSTRGWVGMPGPRSLYRGWVSIPRVGVYQGRGGYAWEGWVNQGRIGYNRGWVYQVYPCPPIYLVMATEVGGTHPTGMLSCFLCTIYLVKCWNDIPQATLLQCTQEVFCTSVLHDVVIV